MIMHYSNANNQNKIKLNIYFISIFKISIFESKIENLDILTSFSIA